MGPPPWSLAAEAHDCFMVRIFRGSNRIQGCGAMLSAQWRGPLGSFSSRLTHPTSVGMSRRGQPIDFGPWTRRTRPGHGRSRASTNQLDITGPIQELLIRARPQRALLLNDD